MYWLYGGNLQFGWSGTPAYDGSPLAAMEDVVVVTVNYRTNGKNMSQIVHTLIELKLLKFSGFQTLLNSPRASKILDS